MEGSSFAVHSFFQEASEFQQQEVCNKFAIEAGKADCKVRIVGEVINLERVKLVHASNGTLNTLSSCLN